MNPRAALARRHLRADEILVINPRRWFALGRALSDGTATLSLDDHGVMTELSHEHDLVGPNGLVVAALGVLATVVPISVHTGESARGLPGLGQAASRIDVVGVQGRERLWNGEIHNHPDVLTHLGALAAASAEVESELRIRGLHDFARLEHRGDVAVAVRWRGLYGWGMEQFP